MQSKQEDNRYYDKYKRNQESRMFYKSKAWQKCRRLVLERDSYLCQECMKNNILTAADMVHHIKHFKDYPELGLDPANLVSLCNSCHNKEHPEKAGGQKKKEVSKKIQVIETKANRVIT